MELLHQAQNSGEGLLNTDRVALVYFRDAVPQVRLISTIYEYSVWKYLKLFFYLFDFGRKTGISSTPDGLLFLNVLRTFLIS